MKTTFYYLCAIFVLLFSNCQASNPYSEKIEKSNQLIENFIKSNKIPGLAISISIKGKTVFSKGYGYANLEQEIKVDPTKSKFRIGSISKPVTADAMIQLWADNKLYLDSAIQYYLPNFPKKKGEITTRLLAGHLAGIRHYNGMEFLSAEHYNDIESALDIFRNDSLISYPGEEYHYSSYAWNLLSRIVEKTSGKEFLSYMEENVFYPLEMNNTVADHTDSLIVHRTGFYAKTQSGEIINGNFVDNSIKWAGGGFLSTAEDMIKFANAHIKEGYLSSKQLTELTNSQKTKNGKLTEYGIGWASGYDELNKYYYGHSGGSIGGTSHMIIYPEEEISVVILTNMSNVRFGNTTHDIANLFMSE